MFHSDRQIEATWDAVIIGSGIAGSTAALALGKAGLKVLVVEKGDKILNLEKFGGKYAETDPKLSSLPQNIQKMSTWGRSEEVWATQNQLFNPFIGQTLGGSSALYGMAMEPLKKEDLTPQNLYKKSNLPGWPVNIDDLTTHYSQAQKIYRVHGNSPLPLSPPLSRANQEVFDELKSANLNPYKLPMACLYKEGCTECQGYLCAKDCKVYSYNSCLRPALENYNVSLLTNCEAKCLNWKKDKISNIEVVIDGKLQTIKSQIFLLAAGAIKSPLLLLNSHNIANTSGMVGKNLMRHLIDIYAIQTSHELQPHDLSKQIACRDIFSEQQPLGYLHSFGRLPPTEVLRSELTAFRSSIARFAVSKTLPLIEKVYLDKLRKRVLLASIVEDFPKISNQVCPPKNSRWQNANIVYKISSDELKRVVQMRNKVKGLFHGRAVTLLSEALNNKRIAHACGTCKMGDSPKDSVVNPENRAHDIKNLYIIDSSFFPTSTRFNPSLTLAANSLRVCAHIANRDCFNEESQKEPNAL